MLLIVAQKAVIFDYILAFEKQSESQESSQRPLSRQYWHRLSYSPQMFDDVLSLDMKLATAISGSLMTLMASPYSGSCKFGRILGNDVLVIIR